MNVLPLNLISELDEELYGQEVINLAKLKRADFPILAGVAVIPSKNVLEKITDILLRTQQIGKYDLLGNQFKDLSLPPEFKKILNNHKKFLFEDKLLTSQLWREVLISWWNEFIKQYRQFDPNLSPKIQLPAKVIFYLDNIKHFKKIALVQCVYDEIYQDMILKSDKKIDPKTLQDIDFQLKSANKFLTLPYNYTLVDFDNSFFITKIRPFTSPSNITHLSRQPIKIPQTSMPKSATQLFINLPVHSHKSFLNNLKELKFEQLNFLINSENFRDFDQMILTITEVAGYYPNCQLIFKLPDLKEHGIRGSFGLISQPEVLNQSAKAILFLRNKKELQNLQVALPFVRTVDEMIKIKRELAALGLNRKGSLKIWLEATTPENFLNIEKYIEVGIDGILVNLDELEVLLVGFKFDDEKGQVLALDSQIRLLENVFRITQKLNIPVIIKGDNIFKSELVAQLIDLGVLGLVVNNLIEAESLPYHFARVEKKLVEKRLNQLLN